MRNVNRLTMLASSLVFNDLVKGGLGFEPFGYGAAFVRERFILNVLGRAAALTTTISFFGRIPFVFAILGFLLKINVGFVFVDFA
ncbi:hypothetical protein MTR67_008615 [Solanum verrucosum]|uniref:Uncharacterized protein n=1 Tax=Solanum verrucosum TaxID=315347 RepID=A0AAF0Q469_SOLVR|nr:hypothetical protein MTR67_008615 [Solanum verrucosum]